MSKLFLSFFIFFIFSAHAAEVELQGGYSVTLIAQKNAWSVTIKKDRRVVLGQSHLSLASALKVVEEFGKQAKPIFRLSDKKNQLQNIAMQEARAQGLLPYTPTPTKCFVVSGLKNESRDSGAFSTFVRAQQDTGVALTIKNKNCETVDSWSTLGERAKNLPLATQLLVVQLAHGNSASIACDKGIESHEDILSTMRRLSGKRKMGVILSSCYSANLIQKKVATDQLADPSLEHLCLISTSQMGRVAAGEPKLLQLINAPEELGSLREKNLLQYFRSYLAQGKSSYTYGGTISAFPWTEFGLDDLFQNLPDAEIRARDPETADLLLDWNKLSKAVESIEIDSEATCPLLSIPCSNRPKLGEGESGVDEMRRLLATTLSAEKFSELYETFMRVPITNPRLSYSRDMISYVKQAVFKPHKRKATFFELYLAFTHSQKTARRSPYFQNFLLDLPAASAAHAREFFEQMERLNTLVIAFLKEQAQDKAILLSCQRQDFLAAVRKIILGQTEQNTLLGQRELTQFADNPASHALKNFTQEHLDDALSADNGLDRKRRQACEDFKL